MVSIVSKVLQEAMELSALIFMDDTDARAENDT